MLGSARRVLATVIVGAVLLALTPASSSAELEDELIKTPTETSVLNTGVMFKSPAGGFMESALFARYPNDARNNFRTRTCTHTHA